MVLKTLRSWRTSAATAKDYPLNFASLVPLSSQYHSKQAAIPFINKPNSRSLLTSYSPCPNKTQASLNLHHPLHHINHHSLYILTLHPSPSNSISGSGTSTGVFGILFSLGYKASTCFFSLSTSRTTDSGTPLA